MATKKRKILVTGSSGVVGSYVTSIFSDGELFLPTKSALNITDREKVLQIFDEIKPSIVIHLAAKTNVDACEHEKEEAQAINTLGTQYIAECCNKHKTKPFIFQLVLYLMVKRNILQEDDTPDPLSVYGRTKLLGEKAVQELVKNYIIVRAGWVIGGGGKEKKFLSYILQQAKDGAKEIRVINDKFGTLTYAKDLAIGIRQLLKENKHGVYHFGSTGICSRYEIAQVAMNLLNINISVTPVPSTFFEERFFAPRPTNEVIKSSRLALSYFRPWKESLSDYVINELQYG